MKATALIAWGVLVASSCAVLVGHIHDIGVFRRTESFHGPFDKESSGTSESYLIRLGQDARWARLFANSGDTPNDPRRSNLRLWVNGQPAGPAHTTHDDIRKHGGGRYSHWGDVLLFSLPAGTTNEPSTVAVVEYSPAMPPSIYGLGCVGVVLASAFLLVRAYRRDPASLRLKPEFIARSAVTLFLVLYGAAAVAAVVYLVTIAIGFWHGEPLPNTAIFRLFPWARELALYEPSTHYVIALTAMVGAVLSWLAPSAFHKHEVTLVRYSTRYGLLPIAALLLFSMGASWSGITRPEDLQSNALGGLVPLYDARGYFEMTFSQVITGHWGPLAEQRPFAAAHRSLLMFLAGYSNVKFLLLQALALACVAYAATRAVMLWRGVWAGCAFLALTLALVRPYLTTHLTEPPGQFWALIAVPFVIRLLRRGALVDGAVSFLAITISLLTRMGSMFTIPGFAVWFAWTQARDAKRLKITLAIIAAVLLASSLVSATLLRLYGSGTGLVGSNSSFVICGATHGGDWRTCQSLYQEDLRKVGPGFGAAQARFLYAKAWEGFRRDPSILAHRLLEGERMFLQNLVPVMLGGYTTPFTPRWFPRVAWTVVAIYGLTVTFWRARERSELSFWLFMWLGLLASTPLVIFADGWRVLSNVLPFVALFFACGFATHGNVASPVAPAGSKTSTLTLAGVCATMLLWIVVPGLAHRLDPLGNQAFTTLTPKPGEAIVLGSRHMAGFIVVPDDRQGPTDVPSMRRSDFTKALEYSGHQPGRELRLPPPASPFAFIAAPNANGTHGMLYVLVAPAEVLTRSEIAVWRLTLEQEIEEVDNVRWARVTAATPAGSDTEAMGGQRFDQRR
jgi:hypothetical protein